MLAKHLRRVTRGLGRVPFTFVCVLLSLALLLASTHANRRYFYCEAMGLLDEDPCAAAAALVEESMEPTVGALADLERTTGIGQGHTDCCAELTLPALPSGTTVVAPNVSPPTLTALPPSSVLPLPTESPIRRPNRSMEKWRPPEASARELRARLMVFLT